MRMLDLWRELAEENLLKDTHGASAEEIARAEKQLGLAFAPEYRAFLSAVGACIARGHEIAGLCPFADMNVVNVTREERVYAPQAQPGWYVLEQAHMDGIVLWQDESGAVYQTAPNTPPSRVASSLAEYLSL